MKVPYPLYMAVPLYIYILLIQAVKLYAEIEKYSKSLVRTANFRPTSCLVGNEIHKYLHQFLLNLTKKKIYDTIKLCII